MKVKVTELRVIEFPAGYLRTYLGKDGRHISWDRTYSMILPKGRRSAVYFTAYYFIEEGVGAYPTTFARAALKRVFVQALKLDAGKTLDDSRTAIKVRRIGKSAAFEVSMPCGEVACIKKSTVTRLIKELESA